MYTKAGNENPEKPAGGKSVSPTGQWRESSGFEVYQLNVVYTNLVNYSDVIKDIK